MLIKVIFLYYKWNQYCKNLFSTKTNLNNHQRRVRYCLKLRGESVEKQYKCKFCDKSFNRNDHLNRHQQTCNSTTKVSELEEKIFKITRHNSELEFKFNEKEKENKELKAHIKELEKQIQEIALKAVSQNFEDETTIEINEDDFLTDSDFIIEEETDIEQEYKQLPPLEVGKGYTIEHREEDGYINVTNLCKAGNKQFKHWKCLEKTRAFLRVLSRSVGIPTDLLLKTQTGGLNENRGTWVHPQVAINIVQWISPAFDVKVSGWVYEIMMTGKVDITNTTSYKKLQEENKQKSMRIQYLTKNMLNHSPEHNTKKEMLSMFLLLL